MKSESSWISYNDIRIGTLLNTINRITGNDAIMLAVEVMMEVQTTMV
jgi:hypothetical protein